MAGRFKADFFGHLSGRERAMPNENPQDLLLLRLA